MSEDDLCVARVPIFQGLTRQEQLHVADFVRPVCVHKGDIVCSPGQSVSRLLVMHSGQLKVSQAAANGQEQILRTVTDGDVVGERAFLTGHLPNDLVVALEDSRMCVFDHTDLSALLRDYRLPIAVTLMAALAGIPSRSYVGTNYCGRALAS